MKKIIGWSILVSLVAGLILLAIELAGWYVVSLTLGIAVLLVLLVFVSVWLIEN